MEKKTLKKSSKIAAALLSPGKIRRGRSPIKVAIEEKGLGIEIKGVKGLEWLTKLHSRQRKCVM